MSEGSDGYTYKDKELLNVNCVLDLEYETIKKKSKEELKQHIVNICQHNLTTGGNDFYKGLLVTTMDDTQTNYDELYEYVQEFVKDVDKAYGKKKKILKEDGYIK
jgi:hypothetical protein